MNKQKTDTHTSPESSENQETMALFAQRLDAASPCVHDTKKAAKEVVRPDTKKAEKHRK